MTVNSLECLGRSRQPKKCKSIFEDRSGKMKVSQGKMHKFLGMTLNSTTTDEVVIVMLDHIKDLLSAFQKAEPKMKGTESSAAPSDFFKVNEDCKKLDSEKAVAFHNLTAKMLHAMKHARPDTCTAAAVFLMMRVQEPDEDDWCKSCHLMKHVKGTKDLPLRLSANGGSVLKWWVDTSCAVHPNMHRHSRGGLLPG